MQLKLNNFFKVLIHLNAPLIANDEIVHIYRYGLKRISTHPHIILGIANICMWNDLINFTWNIIQLQGEVP